MRSAKPSLLFRTSLALSTGNPRARLGINCCAVCGQQSQATKPVDVECNKCWLIDYCSAGHKRLDRKIHSQVCEYLAQGTYASPRAPPAFTVPVIA